MPGTNGCSVVAMFNTPSFSLEDMPTDTVTPTELPVICGNCHQALVQEPRKRSTPRSYAALAQSRNTFNIVDWQGLGIRPCRCCGSQEYGERFAVHTQRKSR